MRRLLAILIVMPLVLQMTLNAQSLSNKERRHINTKVLELVDQYEAAALLSDEDEIYAFRGLFKSEDAKVYCDLMGTETYQTNVSLEEYLKEAESCANGLNIAVYDVKKGKVEYSDGYWNTSVTFRKDMSFVDRNRVLFSTKEYFGDRYVITLNLSYDKSSDECFITSIDGRMNSSKEFPRGKFVIVSRNPEMTERERAYENLYLGGGKPLEYDSFGHAFLSEAPTLNNMDDLLVKPNTIESNSRYDIVSYSFKPLTRRVKGYIGFAPMAYSVKSSGSVKRGRSWAVEFGAAIGGTVRKWENAKLGLYGGVGVSSGNLGLKLNKPLTYGGQNVLIKGDDGYYRPQTVKYEINEATESLGFKDVFIPVYAELEVAVSDIMIVTGDLGLKAYIPLGVEVANPYTVSGTRTIGEEVTEIKDKEFDKFLYPVSAESQFNASVTVNVGADIHLMNKRLFLTGKLGFEQGVMSVFKTEGCRYDDMPLLYDSKGDFACHSMISNVSVMHQAVWVKFGVKYKF